MCKKVVKNLGTINQIKLSAKDIWWHLTREVELICNYLQPCGEKERKHSANYEIFKNSNLFCTYVQSLNALVEMQQMTSTVFTCISCWWDKWCITSNIDEFKLTKQQRKITIKGMQITFRHVAFCKKHSNTRKKVAIVTKSTNKEKTEITNTFIQTGI